MTRQATNNKFSLTLWCEYGIVLLAVFLLDVTVCFSTFSSASPTLIVVYPKRDLLICTGDLENTYFVPTNSSKAIKVVGYFSFLFCDSVDF